MGQRTADEPHPNATDPAAPDAAAQTDPAKPRVLIVDDDPDVCAEIAGLLSERGYEARWLTDPRELETLESFHPQVLILDLGMPSRDGFEVIGHVPEHFLDAQLIIASGHDSRIIQAAARRAESRGVRVLGTLRKPYPPGILLGLLRSFSAPAPPAAATPPAPAPGAPSRIAELLDPENLDAAITVAFQEKRHLDTQTIYGYEALLRSRIPGYANPELFFQHDVPLDLQIAITCLIIRKTLGAARSLPGAAAGDGGPISVNCTPDILVHPLFMTQVEKLLAAEPDITRVLGIEITEHNTLETADEIITAAGRLSVRGFQIALDDFGIGINNFDSLLNLHCEEVKMDKKIFWQFYANRSTDKIIREVIRFCHDRGIRVTVEGIETEDHMAYARDLGADYGQGFLWGRPAPFSPPAPSPGPAALH